MFSRQDVAEQAEDHADGCVEEAEEDESGVERRAVDLEGLMQFRFADEEREDEEHEERRGERDDDALFDVAFFAVSDFVREDADELAGGVVVDEGVEESDAFGFAEAGEVGIGFGGAFGAVDFEDAAQFVFLRISKGFNFRA